MDAGIRNRWVYLVGFPIVTLLLCALSYFEGLKRGEQRLMPEGSNPREVLIPKDHEAAGNLTFFKDLKEKEELPLNPKATPGKIPAHTPPFAPVVTEESHSGYVIQVSAFKDVGKAHELVDDLKNHGYPSFTGGAGGWHRVYVGPFSEKSEAENSIAPLAKDGYGSGFVTQIDAR